MDGHEGLDSGKLHSRHNARAIFGSVPGSPRINLGRLAGRRFVASCSNGAGEFEDVILRDARCLQTSKATCQQLIIARRLQPCRNCG